MDPNEKGEDKRKKISIKKDPSHKDIIVSVAKGMHQAKLASEGKIKSRPAKSFLNEL